MKNPKNLEFFHFQTENVDFFNDFRNTVDELRQRSKAAWRYKGDLLYKPIWDSSASVLPEGWG